MNQVDRFTAIRRVQFSETDMAGIVHFANFFRYMEETEHAFYRAIGMSVHPRNAEVGWPRVHASCDFKLPLRFEEEFEVELIVNEIRDKTIHYKAQFWKDPSGERVLAATGAMTVIAVAMDAKAGTMKAVKIPDSVLEKIRSCSESDSGIEEPGE